MDNEKVNENTNQVAKMKVKILNETWDEKSEEFTARINNFIKNKKVIDIKYSTYADEDGYLYQYVLIMYEEN